ncbi:MAG TPA: ABC transporter ATP-binding protein [Anaerolineaceae bacterium]|nr:ABC transporter ATP-binding protein [Anaerolineaceae bacterium]HPN50849.1 ABC transporter ATP-binding protein [Anaerolineaceae bacterium]
MIKVTGLTKDYGLRRAVENLTFTASKGEILGFLGPNGAGKTTTMRILTGYIPPTSGKVEIGGFDIVDKSIEARRLIGYLPETVPLYNDMTVFDYLMFMANLRNIKQAEDRVDEVLEMVHMEERAEGFVGNLSKGMRQRVGLAQAILHKPEVLILDEPTIGLDPAQIIEVRKIIQELGTEHTVLLSTHILSEAQQVCNRLLIINKGHIVAEDTPEQLQSRLTGSKHITLRVRCGAEDMVPVIHDLPGISSVRLMDENTLEFETSVNQDARPDVARAVISSGLDLLEMTQDTMSLEEIFLQLTRDDFPVLPQESVSASTGEELEEKEE